MVLACVLHHVLMFWTLSSAGRPCLDFCTYSGVLYTIMATVLEQPVLRKLQLSLGDFLCLADSRCFASVYFWVFHEPISDFHVLACLNTSEELFSYQGPG